MKIILKSMSLRNFKGIKELDISLNHITNIYGENAAGKTTIFDCFTWVMFDKDSSYRTDFEVKTLDKNNKTNPKVEVEVTLTFLIDDQEVVLKKVLKEKWVKTRGSQTSTYEGNEKVFYWNEVPLRLKDFQEKVNGLLNEGIFKLITNPLYFNSLKWQDRRSTLITLAGTISDSEVAGNNSGFKELIQKLSNKSLIDYKKEIASKKTKIKDDLATIPARIDEVKRQMPEPIDTAVLDAKIEALAGEIYQVDLSIQDANEAYNSKANSLNELRLEINRLRSENQNTEFGIKTQINIDRNKRQNEISNQENLLQMLQTKEREHSNTISRLNNRLEQLNQQRNELREQWSKINEEQFSFDAAAFVCPTCKRELDPMEVDNQRSKLEENFNNEKQRRLTDVINKGSGYATEIDQITSDLNRPNQDFSGDMSSAQMVLDELKFNHSELNRTEDQQIKTLVSSNASIFTNNAQIKALEEQIESSSLKPADNSELKAKKSALQKDIDELNKQYMVGENIERGNARVKELEQQESNLSQQLADLEGTEFTIAAFTKAKIDMVEARINGKFKHVKFKMYDTQINGGEIECCDTLVNGVPFSDANNAAKINAGLDIINALCQHFNAYAPIFIDNRESVNTLIDCESQIVNLIVSFDKKLKIA